MIPSHRWKAQANFDVNAATTSNVSDISENSKPPNSFESKSSSQSPESLTVNQTSVEPTSVLEPECVSADCEADNGVQQTQDQTSKTESSNESQTSIITTTTNPEKVKEVINEIIELKVANLQLNSSQLNSAPQIMNGNDHIDYQNHLLKERSIINKPEIIEFTHNIKKETHNIKMVTEETANNSDNNNKREKNKNKKKDKKDKTPKKSPRKMMIIPGSDDNSDDKRHQAAMRTTQPKCCTIS